MLMEISALGYLVPNWHSNFEIWLKSVLKLPILRGRSHGALPMEPDAIENIALVIKKLAQNRSD